MDPEPSQARSVLIVEDQMLLLDSLVRTINAHESLRVVGGLTSALDAVEACLRLRPDLLLMDVCTDGGASGLAACREVTTAVPATRVVLMTAMPDFSFPEQARAAGAASFIYKDVSSAELTAVLLSTAEGYSTYPARSTTPFLGYNELSDREIAVLRETCAGRTRAEIAEKFGLSENTIKSNISSILTKTGFRSIPASPSTPSLQDSSSLTVQTPQTRTGPEARMGSDPRVGSCPQAGSDARTRPKARARRREHAPLGHARPRHRSQLRDPDPGDVHPRGIR